MGVAALAGITGCVDEARSSRGATDVIVHNVAATARTVELSHTAR